MKKNKTISLLLGIAASAAALYFAFRNIPLDALITYIASVNYLWIIPAVAASLSAFIARTLRWQSILEPVKKISFANAYHAIMIGFMLNAVFPWRIGEIARPALINKQDNVSFSTALATVAIERIFDILIMFIGLSVILATFDINSGFTADFGSWHLNRESLVAAARNTVITGALIIGAMLILVFKKARNLLGKGIMNLPDLLFFLNSSSKKRFKEGFCIHFKGVIENISSGFLLIKHPVKIMTCIILTFIIWILTALSYYLLALGCPGIDLSFAELSAVMVIVCFFIALPSAPGFWGLWEAGGIFAMSIFGISLTDAAGYTITNHLVQMIPVIIAGLLSAAFTGINIRKLSYQDGKGLRNGNS
jgi:glycosyltransferase 2 family protein